VVKHPNSGREDLDLSPRARVLFPFSIEVKFTETVAIWQALRQAEGYRAPGVTAEQSPPVVFIKRAFTPVYAIVPAEVFLRAWAAYHRQGCTPLRDGSAPQS
jgi:hypothetical protein